MEPDVMPNTEITPSSGNVFADLGLPDPEEYDLKSDLVIQIRHFIEQKGWTQARAAEVIGLDQPSLSKLLRGRFAGFSVERLLLIVRRLGHDVEIHISAEEHAPEETHMLVVVA
jgi:predicted XRE-type DNA-binding protein